VGHGHPARHLFFGAFGSGVDLSGYSSLAAQASQMWSLRKYSSAGIAARHFVHTCFPVRSCNARGGGSSCMREVY
jgi:hypothetical protein